MTESQRTTPAWTGTQAYILAAFCLVLGVVLGYLFRGSASPAENVARASASFGSGTAQMQLPGQPTPEQQKATLDRTLAPLLANLQTSPDDFNTLVQIADAYYDGRQYPDAVKYYQLALKSQPENPDVLTDLGTATWYGGDADGAIGQYQKALKIRPGHPGTLFNLGIVRWQGKLDPKGAVQAWEELLKTNPDYPQRQQVEQYIAKAKQHAQG